MSERAESALELLTKIPALPPEEDAAVWVTSKEALEKLAEEMASAPWIAVDTESNSMFCYRERVCLIQLNVGGSIRLVDPIALSEAPLPGHPSRALDALKAALENPAQVKFVHGAEYDVAALFRDFEIALFPIFDSHQAAEMLGWEKTGYGALVERILGVKLPKDQAQYNWGTRPIDEKAVAYAEDEVRYLPGVCLAMGEAIRKAGLEEELTLALHAVEAMRWHGGFQPENFWKISEVRHLSEPQKRRLFALFCLRDELAMAANMPAGRMINERALLAMAKNPPKTLDDLKAAGIRSATIALRGERILSAVHHPERVPGGYSFPKRPTSEPPDREQKEREARLREWRQKESERRSVSLTAVLPTPALKWLKAHGADDLKAVPQLGDKRIGLYGKTLQKLCQI